MDISSTETEPGQRPVSWGWEADESLGSWVNNGTGSTGKPSDEKTSLQEAKKSNSASGMGGNSPRWSSSSEVERQMQEQEDLLPPVPVRSWPK